MNSDRRTDEKHLEWLRLRTSTGGLGAIPRSEQSNASRATNAIRDADLAESGEPALIVQRSYRWRLRKDYRR